jgi:hypothetical protein
MSGLLDPRQWLLIAALCAASVLGVQFWSGRLVDQGDTAGYARARTEIVAATLGASEVARARETELQAAADKTNKEKDHEINRLRREHAVVVERLLKRPQRPASAANVPAPASDAAPANGCTGAQLYREDGLFSRGEATRAELIRVELMACYVKYANAESTARTGNLMGGQNNK